MAETIRPLAQPLIHQIAAGEVIDSLAAAVRELIDNALDAGATRLGLNLWPEDWSLQLADNGCGLSPADLAQAAYPHSTSKLPGGFLDHIQTLGFRGEALHSLAQLGQLEICSRPLTQERDHQQTEQASGWCAIYDKQGTVLKLKPIAIAPGTIVRVTHLFGHWSQRRQTLPSPRHQLQAIQSVIYNAALCHPQVTWQVRQGDRPWLSIAAGKNAKDILPQVLRSIDPQALRYQRRVLPAFPEGSESLEPLEPSLLKPWNENALELVLGLPDRCHRHRPDWLRVAVNGRCVQINRGDGANALLQPLEQTMLKAFRQALPRYRYPLCFANFQLHPSAVDWHRHPAKTEIYLRGLDHWRSQLYQAIQDLLAFEGSWIHDSPSLAMTKLLQTSEQKGQYHLQTLAVPAHTTTAPADLLALQSNHETLWRGEVQGMEPLRPFSLSDSLPQTVNALLPLKAIAQVNRTYILAEHPDGMWLIEQHIAHERVLYEALQKNWHLVEITPPQRLQGLSPRQIEQLEVLGLTVEAFGHDVWVARTMPKILVDRCDRLDALMELSHTENLSAALAAIACRSAIRNGTELERSQMQSLVDEWQQTQMPRTCPHGRPIFLSLAESDLARFFRRHWVIGKSHGLQ